jgi:hypothetical protein
MSRRNDEGAGGAAEAVVLSERGASFVAVLMALALAAALYFAYFQTQGSISDQKVGIAAIEGSRSFACRTNRQTIERQLTTWLVDHDGEIPTLDDLDSELGPLPTCPEGGRYALSGRTVGCSKHP